MDGQSSIPKRKLLGSSIFFANRAFTCINDVGQRKLYALMISGIIPRPIGFVSTVSENNVYNLAPFRYALFLYACSMPLTSQSSWFNMVRLPSFNQFTIRFIKLFP